MNSKILRPQPKLGLSVLEVLSSMLVALIGVAGVLVMIPFATKQGQAGFDLDRSNTVAANAIAMFEIGEHDRLVDGNPTWVTDDTTTPITLIAAPDTLAIDPLGIVENGAAYAQFPPASSITSAGFTAGTGGAFPFIDVVNLSNYFPANAAATQFSAFTEADAVRMFVNRDSLVFNTEKDSAGTELDELAPPFQVRDVSGGLDIRRQFRGDISWMTILSPLLDSPEVIAGDVPDQWKFEQHILVFKDRTVDQTDIIFPIAQVDLAEMGYVATGTGNNDYLRPGSTIIIDGTASDIRKNDWIMLVNQDPALEVGYQKQVGFFRVIGLGAEYDSGGDTYTPITLDGPNFNLRNGGATIPDLYAVHLVNYPTTFPDDNDRKGHVVNVFQRTMRLKQESVWHK